MTDLPDGWMNAPFSEVVKVSRGITFSTSGRRDELLEGYVACLRTSNVQKMLTTSKLAYVPERCVRRQDQYVRVNDVIMSMSNSAELVGKVALATEAHRGFSYGAFLAALRSETYEARLLWYLMSAAEVQQRLRASSNQTVNIANISVTEMNKLTLPTPPLAEQRRIVAKLDALTARTALARADLDRIPALAARYKQSVLAKAFNGRVTAHWRSLNKADWPSTRTSLASICDPSAPICYGVVQPGSVASGGIPLIRVCDLEVQSIDWPNLRTIDASIHEEYVRSRVKNGDVLVTVVGTIGRLAIVTDAPMEVNIARAVARVRPNAALVSGNFLCLALQAPDVQRTLLLESREVARKTLNLEQLREVSIPVPSMAEQLEIVRILASAFAEIDRLTTEAAAARRLLDRLDQAILAKAFRGELVPQDPADEPASVLLDRIRAERAGAAKPRRGRRAAS